MKLDVEQIEKFARQAARIYISRYGRRPLIDVDDAFSIAFIALLKNNEYDETRSPLEIAKLAKIRAFNAIIREYQNAYGLRRQNPIQFVPFSESFAPCEIEQDKDSNGDEDYKEIIRRSLQQLFSAKSMQIVTAILEGKKQSEVAKEFGISGGRVSQLFSKFKRHAQFYQKWGRNVAIVDTKSEKPTREEINETPLFYYGEKNETDQN